MESLKVLAEITIVAAEVKGFELVCVFMCVSELISRMIGMFQVDG